MEEAVGVSNQTIPKAIREHLGLTSGDRVKFFMHPDGSGVTGEVVLSNPTRSWDDHDPSNRNSAGRRTA
jgi:AbrB family looped-hinge helix DNA binding protein